MTILMKLDLNWTEIWTPAVAFVISIVVILTGIYKVLKIHRYKKAVEGNLCGTTMVRVGRTTKLAPVFRYNIGGKRYKEQTYQLFPQRYIHSHFQLGMTYTIYVDEKHPESFIVDPKMKGEGYLLIGLGIVMFTIFVIATVMLIMG